MLKKRFLFTEPDKGNIFRTRVGDGYFLKIPKIMVGYSTPTGYLKCHFEYLGKLYAVYNHQIIYLSVYQTIPENMTIDHINNEKLDNRISNLQLLTRKQNIQKAWKNRKEENYVRR